MTSTSKVRKLPSFTGHAFDHLNIASVVQEANKVFEFNRNLFDAIIPDDYEDDEVVSNIPSVDEGPQEKAWPLASVASVVAAGKTLFCLLWF